MKTSCNTRRDFLRTLATGTGLLSLSAPLSSKPQEGAGSKSRPDILWLVAEDLCPDLGCYGTDLVKTPNLDGLAREGALYTNAFSTAPVCSPSRSAFMTGMYQTTIGAHQHRTPDKKPLPEPVKLITEYFREAGYFTSNCRFGRWNKPGKTDFNFEIDRPFDGTDWRQRKRNQPFFSLVQFSETHRDFKRDPDDPVDPRKVSLPPCYPDHPLTRRDWADYLECIQVLDKKVGETLERLEEDGLASDTVVIFLSDHGRPHVRGKQWLYDGGIRIPLILRWPGRIPQGVLIDDLVSTIDLGPASMGAASISKPEHMEGRDFLDPKSPKRDHIIAARDRCDETFDRIRCVRTKQFKYIRNFFPHLPYTQTNLYKLRQYPVLTLLEALHGRGGLTSVQEQFMAPCRPPEELYDLTRDPHEIHNLAQDPAFEEKRIRLRGLLDEWIQESGDQGEMTEDPRIAADCFLKRHAPNHGRAMKRRGLPPYPSPQIYLQYWMEKLGVKE